MPENYYIARYRNRNVIAIAFTQRPGLLSAGLKRYQPDTIKRALFRHWLNVSTWCCLPGIWKKISCNQLVDIPGFDLHQWLAAIGDKFSNQQLFPVVVWPPESNRKRIYIHLLNKNGKALGFAKIVFDHENNIKLQRECDTLKSLAINNLKYFHVPSVIDNIPLILNNCGDAPV